MLSKRDKNSNMKGRGLVSVLFLATLWFLFGYLRRQATGYPPPFRAHNGTRNAVDFSDPVRSQGVEAQLHKEELHARLPQIEEPKGDEYSINTQYIERRDWDAPAHEGDYTPGARRSVNLETTTDVDPVNYPQGNGLSVLNDQLVLSEAPPAEEKPARNLKPLLAEILQTILLTLIIFAGVRSVVQNFKVDGASMEPTLHTGQYLLINKIAYVQLEGMVLDLAQQAGVAPRDANSYFPFGGPQRGDIAVFQYPGGPERDFIKRVIGLPGDTVQVERGKVYVNGAMLEEDYIRAVPSYSVPPQKVPAGQYFVLGDNRPNSSDSHIWGYVPEDNMIGKAWVSYWPPSDWGPVPNRGIAAD